MRTLFFSSEINTGFRLCMRYIKNRVWNRISAENRRHLCEYKLLVTIFDNLKESGFHLFNIDDIQMSMLLSRGIRGIVYRCN